MTWKHTIEHWRSLPAEEQTRIRRSRIPLNVAESMAFEGEPVDLEMLRMELARLKMQPVTSKHASAF